MSAVTRAMKMFNEEYPGKFALGTLAKGEKKHSRVKLWEHVLKDFDEQTILTAALHLISIRPDWPPDIATMREQCVLLSDGKLAPETGSEAWEHIRQKISEPKGCENPIQLTELEKEALNRTSSIFDLRSSTNPGAERAAFVKAFDELVAKTRLERVTLPEVKALVERNRPALPEPAVKFALPIPNESCEAPEEALELVAQLAGRMGVE